MGIPSPQPASASYSVTSETARADARRETDREGRNRANLTNPTHFPRRFIFFNSLKCQTGASVPHDLVLAKGHRWSHGGTGRLESSVFCRFAPTTDASVAEPPLINKEPHNGPSRLPADTSSSSLPPSQGTLVGECLIGLPSPPAGPRDIGVDDP